MKNELKRPAKKYFEQDNCGTAYPIYFVIRDVGYAASYHFEDGDRFVAIYDYEELESAESLPKLLKKLKDHEYEFNFPEYFDFDTTGDWWLSDLSQANEGLLDIYSQKETWKESNMFLFKDEADQHLKDNAHHYSKQAHVYCKHGWRAPKTKQLLELLKELQDEI